MFFTSLYIKLQQLYNYIMTNNIKENDSSRDSSDSGARFDYNNYGKNTTQTKI